MPETQESIVAWIDETFPGGDPKSHRKAMRALEEMVELCIADGASFNEVMVSVESACKSALKGSNRITYAGGEGSAIQVSSINPQSEKVPSEAADVLIVLYGLAGLKGFDLHANVDSKMKVNRARRWAARGDGTGYHIKEASGEPQ